MNNQPPKPDSQGRAPRSVTAPKRRSRWRRWLLGLLVIVLLIVFFLPSIATLTIFRGRLLNAIGSRLNAQVSADSVSLGWLSPVQVQDFKVQLGDAGPAMLSVDKIEGQTPLWRLAAGGAWGRYQIDAPELYVEFDRDGSNLGRFLRGMSASTFGNRAAELDITGGRLLLRGPTSRQPWRLENIDLNVQMTPVGESPAGVPVLHGTQAQLMREARLTPDMCDDILKYVVPLFARATRTSGRVSLELDEFHWPLGKSELIELNGRLTLHSVEVSPAILSQTLAGLLQRREISLAVEIAKDEVVSFHMRDGRIYHENLVFRLTAVQADPLIRSRGSVGLDQTLDWYLELPRLRNAPTPDAAASAQKPPTIHITGTLDDPQTAFDGISWPALETLRSLLPR